MEESNSVIDSPITNEETFTLSTAETPNLVQSHCDTTTLKDNLRVLNLYGVSNNNNLEVQSDCDTTMVEFGNVNSETDVPETIDNPTTPGVCLKYRYCSPIDLVPNVPESALPVVGTLFQTLEDCIAMYKKYAQYAGFDIRNATEKKYADKSVKLKYLICHRAGVAKKHDVDSTDLGLRRKVIRNTNFKVTDCKTSVRFVREEDTSFFKLYYFNPHHNHKLFEEHDKVLSRLKRQMKFSADELSKSNYAEFGHVTSFDATYRSNKHCMVFVPFLAIDNNRKSVVVGSGLLCDETTPSYTWLLQAFLKVHKVQPKLVLTDQDAAIKEAFPLVFTEAKHRLCMWHIMAKLPNRVAADVLGKTDFRKRLLKLVWSVFLGPEEFEVKWNDLMKEFNMEAHPWLSLVYMIRSKWIPAYFKELPMCGLMKTTSRSGSLNSFFRSFSHYGNDLLGFVLAHDTAMDRQRNTQRIDEHETNSSIHHFKTRWLIEKHAAMVYTKTVFFDVQKQIIKADLYCTQWNVVSEDGYQKFTIRQKDKRFKTKAEYKVVLFEADGSFACSCQHFEYFGTLCSHIFSVLFNTDVEEIPIRYISKRWTKGVIPSDILRARRLYSGNNEKTDKLINDIQFQFDSILSRIFCNDEKLELVLQKVRSIKDEVAPDIPSDTVGNNKDAEFETMLGVPKATTIDIRASEGIRNKGCGRGKRLIGGGERVVRNAHAKRKCRGCKELTNHDIRNCPIMKTGMVGESDDD
ncbi:hypothetical protein OSB04_un001840 [Centaurea solstitialis]|uniref:SWIM-type domain-containing protein n=1 Tax=Centaurea solstitialis TaxID=347529 RepID=A0AA38W297_9ASTR|nr:hypothetical protein OSB04_un001840 [Centaurea solstitialis]